METHSKLIKHVLKTYKHQFTPKKQNQSYKRHKDNNNLLKNHSKTLLRTFTHVKETHLKPMQNRLKTYKQQHPQQKPHLKENPTETH